MKCKKCNGDVKLCESLIERNEEQHVAVHGVCQSCGVVTDKDGNSTDDKHSKELNVDDLNRWANGGTSDTNIGL